MKTFVALVENSTLTRFLANIFLFIMVVGSAGIAGIEILQGQSPNVWLVGILGTALGASIKILGISAGISFIQQNKEKEVG
jgi:hypothetical protein